jgi:hypothetical protein
VRARQLAELIRQKFDLNIHPRTIERAVAVSSRPTDIITSTVGSYRP